MLDPLGSRGGATRSAGSTGKGPFAGVRAVEWALRAGAEAEEEALPGG